MWNFNEWRKFSALRYLKDKFPFIDRTRTAVWGWSYGGYAAGMILATDPNGVFKCGMSVAPVTDWALYGKHVPKILVIYNRQFISKNNFKNA